MALQIKNLINQELYIWTPHHCALPTLYSHTYCSQGTTEVILWFQTTFSNFHPQSHLYKSMKF